MWLKFVKRSIIFVCFFFYYKKEIYGFGLYFFRFGGAEALTSGPQEEKQTS